MALPEGLDGDKPSVEQIIVSKEVLLDERTLRDVSVDADSLSWSPVIKVEFTDAAAKSLEQLTYRRLGERMAIVVDDQLIAAPVIMGVLARGEMLITMESTTAAVELAAKIERAISTTPRTTPPTVR